MRNVENISESPFTVSTGDYIERYRDTPDSHSDEFVDILINLKHFKINAKPVEKSWEDFKNRITKVE